jgi:hypothetical protein
MEYVADTKCPQKRIFRGKGTTSKGEKIKFLLVLSHPGRTSVIVLRLLTANSYPPYNSQISGTNGTGHAD